MAGLAGLSKTLGLTANKKLLRLFPARSFWVRSIYGTRPLVSFFPAPATQNSPRCASKSRPTRILPTRRIPFPTQLQVLAAFGAIGAGGQVVINNDVASSIGLKPSTISAATAFLYNVGLLSKGGQGYRPSQEVLQFSKAGADHEAARALGPVLRRSWFAQILLPRLKPTLDEDIALQILGEAASALPADYRSELMMLIEYLASSGIIDSEGGHLREAEAAKDLGEAIATRTAVVEGGSDEPIVLIAISRPKPGKVKVEVTALDEEVADWEPAISAILSRMPEVIALKDRALIDAPLPPSLASRIPAWLPEGEAAKLAGVSTRSIRRRATNNTDGEIGKIRRVYHAVPGRREMTLYSRDDILTLSKKRLTLLGAP